MIKFSAQLDVALQRDRKPEAYRQALQSVLDDVRALSAPDEIPLLFEPFYRSPRHRGVKGTGVGLARVRSILDLHRIGLEVANRPEGGAEFRLRFPTVI